MRLIYFHLVFLIAGISQIRCYLMVLSRQSLLNGPLKQFGRLAMSSDSKKGLGDSKPWKPSQKVKDDRPTRAYSREKSNPRASPFSRAADSSSRQAITTIKISDGELDEAFQFENSKAKETQRSYKANNDFGSQSSSNRRQMPYKPRVTDNNKYDSIDEDDDDEEDSLDVRERKGRGQSSWKEVIKGLETSQPTKHSMGKVVKVSDQASEIDELKCKHFDSCGGCTIKGNFTNIPTVKKAQLFFQSEGVKSFPIHLSNHIGWRTHVKLAVQPLSKWGGLKFGLYKPGTHEVEAIPDCQVHHPRINEAIDVLKAEASALGVKGYQPRTDRSEPSGELRYVQLSVERSSNRVQLVLVWNSPTFKEADQTLPRLVKRLKSRYDLFHSITANFQTSSGNTIFNFNAKSWKVLWGPQFVKEKIGEATFLFRPQIFRQVSHES